ncbi:unnamed protein product, partial [Prorocentrum cordatum]
MALSNYTCVKCGRNQNVRIDPTCASNKRNMERKVKKKDPNDKLCKWWKELQKYPKREQAWYKKMKAKDKHSQMSEDHIMAEEEESQKQLIEHWKNIVAKPKDKITDESGEVFIAKVRVIIVDHVKNNMATSRVKRQKICNNADDLNAAVGDNLKSMDQFWRALKLSRPISMTAIPFEAKQVDTIGSNTSESITNAFSKTVMQQTVQQDMMQQQIRQAQEEADMMEEVADDMQKIAQAQQEQSEQARQSPSAQRTAYSTLKTRLIEKPAKLNSSIARLRNDLAQPEMDLSAMEGEDATTTKEAAGSIKFPWGQLVFLPSQVGRDTMRPRWNHDGPCKDNAKFEANAEDAFNTYTENVRVWKETYQLETLAPNGSVAGDSANLLQPALGDFKRFFSEEGHAKPFRLRMAERRAFAKGVEKKNKALEKAQAKSSAARSRRNAGAQQGGDESYVPVIEPLVPDGHSLDGLDVSDKVADFNQTEAVKFKVDDLGVIANAGNYQTQVKWAKATMSKDGLDSMVTEISDKKLNDVVNQMFAGMGSRIKPASNFFIAFPPEHAELKKAIVDYQICVYDGGYSAVNATAFCLPEVICCVSGAMHLVGLSLDAVDGDTVAKKLKAANSYDKRTAMKI